MTSNPSDSVEQRIGVDRRQFLQALGAVGIAGSVGPREAATAFHTAATRTVPAAQSAFPLSELTIEGLQHAYASKRFTTEEVVHLYLKRISEIDQAGPRLKSVLEINPKAYDEARRLDRERAAGRILGPLHGVPVLLKDVIDTADGMHSTAGSLALMGSLPLEDAFIVQRLRQAGALLLGKTNLSEWSNCRSSNPTSGWSARGGLTRNPYILDRTACGSSSGTAVAVSANLSMLGIGADTDGSIACPASANGLVGVKPTVGLCSRTGMIPVSITQDSAGPLTRTVRDAAILLSAMRGVDNRDLATEAAAPHMNVDYLSGLQPGALKGARLGVMRVSHDESSPAAQVFDKALRALEEAGATVIDHVEYPSIDDLQRAEVIVLLCEFKDLIRNYLSMRGPEERHRSLADLIRFNVDNAAVEMEWFGQEWFEASEVTSGRQTPDYIPALSRCRQLARTMGIDKAMSDYNLDAVVTLAAGPAFAVDLLNGDHAMPSVTSLGSVAGYPRVTVPAGHVRGLPVGISFKGLPWTEARLLAFAYAFEQHTRVRIAPRFLPTADFDR
ncbi:MAG TPA: amidase [Gemmatimonadaceae bacterium]